MDGFASSQIHCRCPQGVVGGWNQDFVTIVEQRLAGHDNQLTDAVTQENIINVHIWDGEALTFLHDRLASRKKAFGCSVSLGRAQIVNHISDDFVGRIEAKRGGITDVQFQDSMTFFFESSRMIEHRTTNVVTNPLKLFGFFDVLHCAVVTF